MDMLSWIRCENADGGFNTGASGGREIRSSGVQGEERRITSKGPLPVEILTELLYANSVRGEVKS